MLFRLLLSVGLVGVALSVSVNSYLSQLDKESLQRVFESALSKPKDVAALYYGLSGLKLLNAKVPDPQGFCNYLKGNVDGKSFEGLFVGGGAAFLLENCKLDLPNAAKTINDGITDEQTVSNLGYIAAAARYLNVKVDEAKLLKAFTAATKKDDSVSSLAYAFHAVHRFGGDLKPFINRIEDVVAQADEINGEQLQFEGGLSVTARVISGIYQLAEKMNGTAQPMKPEEAVKFTNYLLGRKGAQLPRPAFHLLRAVAVLAKNKHHHPVYITRVSPVAVTPTENKVQLKICDIMGDAIVGASATVETATHKASSGVVISKKALTSVPSDTTKTLFEFNFLEQKRERGFYDLEIAVASAKDKSLVGTKGQASLKVLTEISIEGVEVSVVDRDQHASASVLKVQHPNKLPATVEADYHQKFLMKFSLKDKQTNTPVTVHQAFVVFAHVDSKQEIVFVAEPDSTKTYKFDVDLQKSGKDFDYLSGKYHMNLILGDGVMSNPVMWKVAELSLKFPIQDAKPTETSATVNYHKKPEIKHIFREPDTRPPKVVSDAFTVLALFPILVLLVAWISIGVNMSGFSFSLYTLGFHVGLGGIFFLYFMFFVELNMFETMKYLAGVGGVTFLCGNAMLRAMAERRKQKTE